MKKILLIVLAALLLTGCNNTSTETEESKASVQVEVAKGREDREILQDYMTIQPSGEHDVQILFTNAGKADCILVMVDSYTALIDTGTSASPATVLPALEMMAVEKLDAVYFTHSDKDHVGGYETIAQEYPVETVYTSSISAEWETVDSIIGETERIALDPGAVVEISDGVWFEVMGPIRYNPDDNENSLVLRLNVNGITALFTGDMKYNEETSLIYNEMPLDCDILKVGYHGRKDATSVKFIEATTPQVAVISTDRDEDADSAHDSIIDGLGEHGAKVYVTDESELGILVKVKNTGKIEVNELKTAENPKDVRILSVSKEDQTVEIKNEEKTDVDISGWYITSETGKELFRFPDGAVISAGDSIVVACAGYNGECDFIWEDSRVWHKSKDDRAFLTDKWGNRVSSAESE